MQLEDVDVPRVAKLVLRNVESATCFSCLRYFTRPERSTCGHVLCHHCWLGRSSCPCCKAPVQRSLLSFDSNMQRVTNNATKLVEAFEQLFRVPLTEFVPMDTSEDSLTSSDNHLSAPYFNQIETVPDIEGIPQIRAEASHSTCPKKGILVSVPQDDCDKIETVPDTENIPQIHAEACSSTFPKKVTHVSVPQGDWNKIKAVLDTEDFLQRNKENVMHSNFRPFTYYENEFSNQHPRRSTLKKVKTDISREKSPTKSEDPVKTSNNSSFVIENMSKSSQGIQIIITKLVNNATQTSNYKPNSHIQTSNTSTVAVQTDYQSKNNDLSMATQKYAVTKQKPVVSTRKNTPFAATATAHFLVPEGFEKNLSDIMECDEEMNKIENAAKSPPLKICTHTNMINNIHDSNKDALGRVEKDIPDYLNSDDMDMSNSGPLNEHNKQMVDISYPKTTAEILVSTLKNSKSKTQKLAVKRSRELDDTAESSMKRQKIQTPEKSIINVNEVFVQEQNKTSNDSEYDELMGQVFASIDADTQQSQKLRITDKKSNSKTTQALNKTKENTQNALEKSQTANKFAGEKYSENLLSAVGNMLPKGNNHVPGPETQQNVANLLTPGMCLEVAGPDQDIPNDAEPRVDTQCQDNEEIVVMCTPMDEDDSDKSVFEEISKKNVSTPKNRSDSGHSRASNNKKLQAVKPKVNDSNTTTATYEGKSLDSQDSWSTINWTVSVRISTSKNDDAVENPTQSETSLSMKRFVASVRHNSTFVANNPYSPARRCLVDKNVIAETTKRFCVAGSCLSSADLRNLKMLCLRRKWAYVDKYRPDLTHLVVAVDDENKSQRSVKYMCALAAGKWIISYRWVEKCLERNTAVNEEPYEVLDLTGEPGPRRSRLTDSKIFAGFTFYCLPPFSIFDLNTLQSMLQAAGARVVEDPREVKIASSEPCVLLCEPKNTEEDRYIHLVMQLGVVPVNYNWALDCLGDYALCSLYDYLVCPSAMLPHQAQQWPPELTQRSDDTEVLTWTCCAFVLMLLMLSVLMMVVYGISVGYHYAQKELASFASSSRSTTMEPVGAGGRRMGGYDAPVVRLVAVNKSELTTPPEPLIEIYKTPSLEEQVLLDETVTPAVFLETERPPEEPELSSNERELARKLIGRFRRSRNNTSSTSFLRPLKEMTRTVAVLVGNSSAAFVIS